MIWILTNRKHRKRDDIIHPKERTPNYIDPCDLNYIDPCDSKKHKHIFEVIDEFNKFTWYYPTKSMDTADVISRESHGHDFLNPAKFINDRGSKFTSTSFKDYCNKPACHHHNRPFTIKLVKQKSELRPLLSFFRNSLGTILRNGTPTYPFYKSKIQHFNEASR